MAFSEEYYILVEGEQKGPYTFPQLKGMWERKLVPTETLYWQDGMEQWELVADLCGGRRRGSRVLKKRWPKQARAAALVLGGAAVLLLGYCGPVLVDGWREMNEGGRTAEGAYWRARGYVRDKVKGEDESVAFEPYGTAQVTVTGTAATVILPGTLFEKDGRTARMRWKVGLVYDAGKRAWLLAAQG